MRKRLIPFRLWFRFRLLPLAFCCVCLAARLGFTETPPARDSAPIAPLALTDHGGEIGFKTDYLEETQSREGTGAVKFRNLSFEEYLLYRFNGYVYHPWFLDFRTRFQLGMLQQLVERSGGSLDNESRRHDAFLSEYDVFLRFFQKEPLSLDLFARRTHDVVRQLFTDRILTRSEEYGVLLHWKEAPFPMDLAYRRNSLVQEGIESYSESTNDSVEYTVRNYFRDRMRTELSYRYQDYKQYFELSNPLVDLKRRTSFESHDARLDNTLYLLDGKSTYLNSAIRYYDQIGDQDIQNFSWWERLNLQHRKNLRTYYLLNLLRNDFDGGFVRTYRAESGVEHRLYDSLDSHADVHWRQSEYVRAEDTEYGVTGRLNYRKKTPAGYLTMGYAVTRNYLDRRGDSVVRNVVDEQVTLSANEVRFLGFRNARADSIVVTDQAGLVLYTEGFDYLIETFGDRTGLRLLLGGLLNEGETVLVDYEYEMETDPDINYYTTDQSFSARYDWAQYVRGLSTYLRWHDSRADGEDGRADLRDLAMSSWLVGMRYPWRWCAWTEEYEEYNSFSTDYGQLRSEIEGSVQLRPGLHWGGQVGMLNVDYRDGDRWRGSERYSEVYYASTTLRGKIFARGFWNLEARGRRESGVTDETLLGFLGRMGLRWRKTKLSLGCRLEERDRFDSERSRVHVFLQLSREL